MGKLYLFCALFFTLDYFAFSEFTQEATYRSRTRRALSSLDEGFDAPEVEKYIVGEFGATACIYERVCAHYAARAQGRPRKQLDWPNVFSQYKRSPDQNKEFYLLSVFLGDILGSPQLCLQLGKRRSCGTAADLL